MSRRAGLLVIAQEAGGAKHAASSSSKRLTPHASTTAPSGARATAAQWPRPRSCRKKAHSGAASPRTRTRAAVQRREGGRRRAAVGGSAPEHRGVSACLPPKSFSAVPQTCAGGIIQAKLQLPQIVAQPLPAGLDIRLLQRPPLPVGLEERRQAGGGVSPSTVHHCHACSHEGNPTPT